MHIRFETKVWPPQLTGIDLNTIGLCRLLFVQLIAKISHELLRDCGHGVGCPRRILRLANGHNLASWFGDNFVFLIRNQGLFLHPMGHR